MKSADHQPTKKPQFDRGIVYPGAWRDLGRGLLTREQIERQASKAALMYAEAMGAGPVWVVPKW